MLASLIRKLGLADSAVGDVVAALNAETVEKVDDQLYTWAGVIELIGQAATENFRLTLEAQSLGAFVYQLGGKGLDLSHSITQELLANFVAAGVPGADILKAQGRHFVSPYVDDGGAGLVLEADAQAALDQIALEDSRTAGRLAAAEQYNQAVALIDAWDGSGTVPALVIQ